MHLRTFGQWATRSWIPLGYKAWHFLPHRERCAGYISQLPLSLTVFFIFSHLLRLHLHCSSFPSFCVLLFGLILFPILSILQLLLVAMGNWMNKEPPPPMVLVPPLFDYPPLAARTRYVFSNLLFCSYHLCAMPRRFLRVRLQITIFQLMWLGSWVLHVGHFFFFFEVLLDI